MANKNLILLGVSGDGDSASIGLGQFGHMIDLEIADNHIDFRPEREAVKQTGSHDVAKPTKEILAGLESRLAQGRGNNNFWVDSGY